MVVYISGNLLHDLVVYVDFFYNIFLILLASCDEEYKLSQSHTYEAR